MYECQRKFSFVDLRKDSKQLNECDVIRMLYMSHLLGLIALHKIPFACLKPTNGQKMTKSFAT